MLSVVDRNVVIRRMTSTTCRLSTWATKLDLAHLCTYRLLSLAVAARDGLPGKQRSLRGDVLPRTDCCHVLSASVVEFLSDA
jgi:hypothetical protein